jgi:flagellar assembly protein FliH
MAQRATFVPRPLGAETGDVRFVPDAAEDVSAAEGAPAQPAEAPPRAAPVDLDALRAAAFEEGRAAGRAELPWHDAEALRHATSALLAAARALAALRRQYLRDQRRAVVDLAVAIAERLLRRQVAARPDALAGVVERAIEAAGPERPLRLALSPQDLASVRDGQAVELAGLASEHGIELVADPSLARGDARAFAGRAVVDARVEDTIARVREELVDAALGVGDEGGEA